MKSSRRVGNSKVKANKDHKCSTCKKTIRKGRKYISDSGKDKEGEYSTIKYCLQCKKL